MGEGRRHMTQAPCSPCVYNHGKDHDDEWIIMNGEDDHDHPYMNIAPSASPSSSTSSLGDSTVSNGSSLSSSISDIVDDASSSSSSTHSSSSSLNDLSELMDQLPIKRGLSKFYHGKSQSFTNLSRVTSIDELPKAQTPLIRSKKMIKASKSYAGGLDRYKSYSLIPRPIISKKASKGSLSSSSSPSSRRGSFVSSSCRPPLIPSQNKLE